LIIFFNFDYSKIKFFETKFLDAANKLLSELDPKIVRKVLYNIDLAEQTYDPKLLKKLTQEIWEFRTNYSGLQIRFLAFWDKREKNKSLVIATHGFFKKGEKVPKNEIERALKLKENYFTTF
jgi:phage-related protein